jgi:hypothetical protein
MSDANNNEMQAVRPADAGAKKVSSVQLYKKSSSS